MASIHRKLSGRAGEQRLLAKALASSKSEFIAVYGRRRVGKTFLVRRFFQDLDVRYFEIVGQQGASKADQLELFADAVSTSFHGGRRRPPAPRSWREACRVLGEEIDAAVRPASGRYVLFFDELPWLASARSGCLQALEHFWNAWCQRRDDIVLIVCGSAASWMLRKLVHARGGLHNRLTRTLRLLPFTLAETREFFVDRGLSFTNREVAELYMSVGGIPHYLDHVERGPSVAQLIDQLYLGRSAPLGDEFGRLFVSLFRNHTGHVDVVKALARKRRGLNRTELLASAALPTGGGATTILTNLEEGGFIESTIPFGRTSRDRLFRLTDELSLFHLKWLASRSPASWQTVRGTPKWQAWAGLAFESLCLKHADAIQHALGISGVRVETSAWLHPKARIDLVLDRADDVVTLCEMKFTDAPFTITARYADELRNKLAVFREATGTRKALRLVLVTSYGVNENAHARELVDEVLTLEDLFDGARRRV